MGAVSPREDEVLAEVESDEDETEEAVPGGATPERDTNMDVGAANGSVSGS